jgi:glucose/arabinose dehydrogenase
VVNERDGLGDGLVPDYLAEMTDGVFYGWPYSYYGQHADPQQVERHRPPIDRQRASSHFVSALRVMLTSDSA